MSGTIEAAKASNLIDRVYVNTDSIDYGKLAVPNGAQWIIRPFKLAEDVPTEDVIHQALSVIRAEGHIANPIVTLQCTTPLMTQDDIDSALNTYLHGIYKSVISITEVRDYPLWTFHIEGKHLKPFLVEEDAMSGDWGIRQTLPKLYRPNGAIYITRCSVIEGEDSMISPAIGYHYMPLERSWDVDTEQDLKILEVLAP